MSRRIQALVVSCAAAALVAGLALVPAAAAAGNPIINDCENNGQLTHSYTLKELEHARATMPASIKEYSNCYDVISRAIIQARGSGAGRAGGNTGGSGGSFLPTPVIVILAVLIVAALTFGALALRRRRSGGGPPSSPGTAGPSRADPPQT